MPRLHIRILFIPISIYPFPKSYICGGEGGDAFCIKVMESPLSNILPIFVLFPVFKSHSSALSRVIFMYSSKPIICPSSAILVSSYNQILTLFFCCNMLEIVIIDGKEEKGWVSFNRRRDKYPIGHKILTCKWPNITLIGCVVTFLALFGGILIYIK